MAKLTKEEFITQVKEANGHLFEPLIDDEFKGVDSRYKFKCKHGVYENYGWSLKKPRPHCCKLGYWENKVKPELEATAEFIKKASMIWKDIDYSKCAMVGDAANKGHKIILRCVTHDEWFEQHPGAHLKSRLGCKTCKSKQASRISKQKHLDGVFDRVHTYISKPEKSWLDSLTVPERQYRLKDVENYNVDGYDPSTNTVYLYHGRFWHGCPETYDPEEIHPIIGIKMKELYDRTILWEQKIKNAGYNLVTKWGT
jgi:hypothetical protein